eukprot:scaffold3597_cov395-Prasinococcus_capsulatus_cf.AAC.4
MVDPAPISPAWRAAVRYVPMRAQARKLAYQPGRQLCRPNPTRPAGGLWAHERTSGHHRLRWCAMLAAQVEAAPSPTMQQRVHSQDPADRSAAGPLFHRRSLAPRGTKRWRGDGRRRLTRWDLA